jgi:hypothetical protein
MASVLNKCILPRTLVHQAGSQFECLSLLRRRERASDPVDSHGVVEGAETTTPAAPLLLRGLELWKLVSCRRSLSAAQDYPGSVRNLGGILQLARFGKGEGRGWW